MKLRSQPSISADVQVFWSGDDDYRAPTLRDAEGRCMQPFTHYLDAHVASLRKARKRGTAARSATDAMTYALRAFAVFLTQSQIPLWRVDDDVLVAFRDWARTQVESNPKSRGLPHQVSATVNIKLIHVYDLMWWCQKERQLPDNTMGWLDCKVQSTLPQVHAHPSSDFVHRRSNKYPQLYDDDADSSRTNEGQHWATPEEIEQLEEFFWETQTIQSAERNCLMLRILDFQAWRIGSANSLLVSQFTEQSFQKYANHDHFIIRPPRQKYGRSKSFEMPWELANRIKRYIEDEEVGRASIFRTLGRNQRDADGHVFISHRDGTRLSDRSWLQIFGRAYKTVLGQDFKGAGTHSIRRHGAERDAGQYMDYLKSENIAVTKELVISHLMETLGHTSEESYGAYLRVMRLRRARSEVALLDAQLRQAKLKNDELVTRVASMAQANEQLQRLLEDLQAQVKAPSRRRGSKVRDRATIPA